MGGRSQRSYSRSGPYSPKSVEGFITINYPKDQDESQRKSIIQARQKRTKREFRQFLKDKAKLGRSQSMPGTIPQRKPADRKEFDRFKTYLKLVGRQRPKPSRPTLQPGEYEMVLEPTAEFLYDQCQKGALRPEQITPETIE